MFIAERREQVRRQLSRARADLDDQERLTGKAFAPQISKGAGKHSAEGRVNIA